MNAPDLHVHSAFSIYDGLGLPKLHVARAKELGWGAVCLTEHGWMGSAPTLYKAAKEAGIKPILGMEMYVVPDEFLIRDKSADGQTRHLTVLALSAEGYHNLVVWSSLSMDDKRGYFWRKPRISIERMIRYAPFPLHHNVVLSGCLGSELCQSLLHLNGEAGYAGAAYIESMKAAFPNFYIEIHDHANDKYLGGGYENYENLILAQSIVRGKLLDLAQLTNTPIVVSNDSHYPSLAQQKAHIAQLAAKAHRRQPEAHEGASTGTTNASFTPQYTYWQAYMQPMEDIADKLPNGWGERAIENMHAIVEEANIVLEPLDKFSYCVAPDTRILTCALEWVTASSLREGDRVFGFDEESKRGAVRAWRIATIEKAGSAILECYRIVFDSGDEVVVSSDHQWVACKRDGKGTTQAEWRLTRDLRSGDRVPKFLEPWGADDSWESGWLAGIYDGEGSFSKKGQLTIAQLPGPVCDLVQDALTARGCDHVVYSYPEKPTHAVHITDRIAGKLRLLGEVRPIRLLDKVIGVLEGRRLERMSIASIVSCEPIGPQPVVTLATSTHTFFAEGFGAHNSIPFSGYNDTDAELRHRCKARLKSMAALHGAKLIYDRFEYELSAMHEFGHYLLLVADGIKMTRDNGILTWVRGSAANSLVCYCLRIHDIDPIEYKLMFERFVNPARAKMPDVDIDTESDKRDLAVRMIAEHMEPLEGKGNVLPICTYGTLANRAAFRMMAEVEGFSKERIDELAALLPQMIDSGMVTDESTAYELLKDEDPDLYDLASQVFDAPSTVSQHACGLAFGTRDRPLHLWVPRYRIASSDAVVTQYNMKYIEEMGLTKQDWLKLDTLKIMRSVLQLIGKDDRYLDDMPLDDKDTFELLRAGKTEGVHSFQGPTQRRGCIEVKPESIHDLVVIQALYRPSGTRTGFVTAYVNRRFGREDWESSRNPHVAANLADTYGLPIFQEQIMQAGADMGMSGAEIDDMYKAIKTAKGIGRGAEELFAAFRPTYMKYALKWADKETAEDDWRLFDAFQGYGFNRGHATSYALLGYRNGFLKAHHRREFYTAILEAYPDNPTFTAATIADGFKFEPPDINSSAGGFSPGGSDKAIRIGLLRVRDVGVGAVGDIVRNQPFRSLDDLRARTSSNKVDKTVVDNLRAVGALAPFGIKGDDDDVTSFQLLKFVPRKPLAFTGCKPQLRQRRGGSWTFRGLMTGFERFTDKSFCAKMFWIPPLALDDDGSVSTKLLTKKASAMGNYYAWLLTAVDENGLPFDLIVGDKKESESKLVRLLAKQNQEPGTVICVEGQPTQPFLRGRPTGFRLWGIAGAEDGNAQMWHCDEETAKLVCYLADEKHRERQR